MKVANVVKALVGFIGGTVAGGTIGFGVAAALMYHEKWKHPEDPSASSAGNVAMLTVPIGLFVGIIVGGLLAARSIEQRDTSSLSKPRK